LAHRPASRLVPTDLIKLLKKLRTVNDKALVLNVLHPLLPNFCAKKRGF
jgi:hypothetical protein